MKKLFKRTMSCVMAVAIMASMSINACKRMVDPKPRKIY